MTDRIELRNMVFRGRHGWYEHEQENPQRFEVDIVLGLDLRAAGVSDDLARTVDYGRLFELAREIVEGRSFRLLEAVAETIAGEVLSGFPAVGSVVVRVRKPEVQLRGRLDWSGVEIRRERPV